MKAETARNAGLVLFGLAAGLGGLALLIYRLDEPQRERQAIRELMEDIGRRVTAQDRGEKSLLEELVRVSEPDPARRQLRADLERLARLDQLRFYGLRIDIQADTGTADYAIEATTPPAGSPAPRGGQFVFRRGPGGWTLAAHQFHHGSAPPAGQSPLSAPSRGSRPHVHRWTREPLVTALGGMAVLALLGAVAFFIHPLIRRETSARHGSRRRRQRRHP